MTMEPKTLTTVWNKDLTGSFPSPLGGPYRCRLIFGYYRTRGYNSKKKVISPTQVGGLRAYLSFSACDPVVTHLLPHPELVGPSRIYDMQGSYSYENVEQCHSVRKRRRM